MARHLPADSSSFEIERQRREMIDHVTQKAKRVNHIIKELGHQRRDLVKSRHDMMDILGMDTKKKRKKKKADVAREEQQAKSADFMRCATGFKNKRMSAMVDGRPSDRELVHFFNQDSVSPEDKLVRETAKRANIKILDAEAIKYQFDKYDADGSGEIEKGEFKTLFLKLLGVRVINLFIF